MSAKLREMSVDDLELVRTWRNHPKINKFMFTQSEISAEAHKKWFESTRKDASKQLLIYTETTKPLGFIQFSAIRNFNKLVEWGFYVAPDASKGTGSRMTALAIEFAFNDLHIHKIFAEILDYNEPSIQLHRKLGFNQEGLLKDHHYDGENYHSVICFGLINPLANQ